MPNLSIKSVPEALAESLRRRAARNHRSLQGELMAILESAVLSEGQGSEPRSAKRLDFADAAAAFRARFPTAVPDPKDAATLIREMRDTHYGDAWVMAGIKDGEWPPRGAGSGESS